MSILSDYRNKVNVRGSTPRERTVNYRVNNYNETFTRAPEYEQVKLTQTDAENSTLYDIWLYANSSYKELVDMKTVIFAPGTPEEVVFSGQYMRLQPRDNRPEELFMIVSDDKQYDTKIKAMVDECTETLRWYDDNGVLQEYPVVVMNSYRKGLNEDKYMVLTSGQYIIGVPQNDITFKLQEGNEFILNRKHKYRIAGFEDIESSTFMTITLDKYEENPSVDDIENGIANFAIRPRFTLNVDPMDGQISIGNTYQVKHILLDKDGKVSNKPVSYSSSDESICTVDSSGLVTAIANGNCAITVTMTNNVNVSDTLDIEVTATPVDNIVYLVEPDFTRLVRQEDQTFTVEKNNNGQSEVETYTISIDSTTVDSDDYEFETVGTDGFRIFNKGATGTFDVMITPNGDVGNAFVVSYTFSNGFW